MGDQNENRRSKADLFCTITFLSGTEISVGKTAERLGAKMQAVPNGRELYEKEGVALELSYNAVCEKYDEYQNFMEKLTEMHTLYFNAEATGTAG